MLKADEADDFTLQRRVKGLKPGSRYLYRFTARKGRRSDSGTFVTAPRPKANATVEFAWTGDTDFSPELGETTPFWNSGEVFHRMLAERNDLRSTSTPATRSTRTARFRVSCSRSL